MPPFEEQTPDEARGRCPPPCARWPAPAPRWPPSRTAQIAGVPVRVYRPTTASGPARARVLPRRRLGDRRPRQPRRRRPGAGRPGRRRASCRSTTGSRPSTSSRPPSTTAVAVTQLGARPRRRAGRRPGRAWPSAATRPAATWPPIVAHELRGRLAFQLLVYPATEMTDELPVDRRRTARATSSRRASMEWFVGPLPRRHRRRPPRPAPVAAEQRPTGRGCRRPW